MFLRIDKLQIEMPASPEADPAAAANVQGLLGGREELGHIELVAASSTPCRMVPARTSTTVKSPQERPSAICRPVSIRITLSRASRMPSVLTAWARRGVAITCYRAET